MLVLLAAGQENAAVLLKRFDQADIATLAGASARLGDVELKAVEAAAQAFQAAYDATPAFAGDPSEFRAFLTQASVAAAPQDGVPSEVATIYDRVASLEQARLLTFLEAQHPQVIAFLLVRMGQGRASELLARFSAPQRKDLLMRMLTIGVVHFELVSTIEACLEKGLLSAPVPSSKHKTIAGIVNNFDSPTFDEFLAHIQEQSPDDAKELRKHMLRFDDLRLLTLAERNQIVDKTPAEVLILALHGANADTRDAVLTALAPRVRRMVEGELNAGTAIAPREVTEARRQISDMALRLVADGKIAPPSQLSATS
jgi:flagellar motor switch protein FliG